MKAEDADVEPVVELLLAVLVVIGSSVPRREMMVKKAFSPPPRSYVPRTDSVGVESVPDDTSVCELRFEFSLV